MPTSESRRVAGSALRALALAVVLGLLGFLQSRVLLQRLGAGNLVDSYYVVTTVPMAVVTLLGTLLTAILVPLYSRRAASEREGDTPVLLATALLATALAVLSLPTSYMLGLWPSHQGLGDGRLWLVGVVLGAASYGYSWSPQLMLVSQRKTYHAQIAQIASFVTFLLLMVLATPTSLAGLTLVFACGGLTQAIVATAFVVRSNDFGLGLSTAWLASASRNMLLGLGPAFLATAAMQASVIVDRLFSQNAGDGVVTAFAMSDKITQMLLAMIATTLGLVLFPEFTSVERGPKVAGEALAGIVVLLAPITAALTFGGRDAVAFLFGGGQFGPGASNSLGSMLSAMAPTMLTGAVVLTLARRLQAVGKYWVQTLIAASLLAANLLCKVLFVPLFGGLGLAYASNFAYAAAGILGIAWCIRSPGLVSMSSGARRDVLVMVVASLGVVLLVRGLASMTGVPSLMLMVATPYALGLVFRVRSIELAWGTIWRRTT